MNNPNDHARKHWQLTLCAALFMLSASALFAPALAEDGVRIGGKCRECGVVESRREIQQADVRVVTKKAGRSAIASQSPKNFEVTVRMGDGSSHVFMDRNVANWRPGERMIVIEGTSPSND